MPEDKATALQEWVASVKTFQVSLSHAWSLLQSVAKHGQVSSLLDDRLSTFLGMWGADATGVASEFIKTGNPVQRFRDSFFGIVHSTVLEIVRKELESYGDFVIAVTRKAVDKDMLVALTTETETKPDAESKSLCTRCNHLLTLSSPADGAPCPGITLASSDGTNCVACPEGFGSL